MDGPPVAEGPRPPPGGEHLPGKGVVDQAQQGPPLRRQGQGDGAVAEAVDQVGGAVHRVQDPDRPGRVDGGVVLFLCHELDAGVKLRQRIAQKRLHSGVHRGDEVGAALGVDLGGPLPVAQQLPGLPQEGGRRRFQSLRRHTAALLAASTAGDSPPLRSNTET